MTRPASELESPAFDEVDFYLGDPGETYRVLRREAPVYWWEPREGPGMWILTRWSDIREVSRRPQLYCSSQGIRLIDGLRRGASDSAGHAGGFDTIVHMDPPRHGEVRALLNKVFTPRRVTALEPWMRALCRRTLEALPTREPVNLVSEVAAPVPAITIAQILGVPEAEWRDFQASADALIALEAGTLESDGPEGAAAARAGEQVAVLFRKLRGWIDERKSAPADDLLSALVHVEEDGSSFEAADVLIMAVTLLVAGNETTRTLISGACLALSEHPAQRELLLARPELLPDAIEEFLRWVTPIHSHARTVTRDTELRGQTLRAGDFVVMMYGSANRDEEVWADPDRLDLTRPAGDNPHLSFGYGEHFCLGASLARLEARVVCEELLRRFPHFALQGDVERQRSTHFNGIVQMPVVLDGGG